MVSVFAGNSKTFKERQRGEYNSFERKILENTAKMIANTLELDSNVKRVRILLRKEDKLQAIKKKRPAA
jgi:DNA polymerase III sliding clamp (beta) subunit (PCNA family)